MHYPLPTHCLPLMPLLPTGPHGPMPPSTPPPTQQTSLNHKSQSDDKFTITNHNRQYTKRQTHRTNINRVKIKLSNYSSIKLSNFTQKKEKERERKLANQIKSLVLKRETLISLKSLSNFQSSEKREREKEK